MTNPDDLATICATLIEYAQSESIRDSRTFLEAARLLQDYARVVDGQPRRIARIGSTALTDRSS